MSVRSRVARKARRARVTLVCLLALCLAALGCLLPFFRHTAAWSLSVPEESCDVLVVGGSTGGTAAALSAADGGAKVVLLVEGDWLGGQMTSQGVSTLDEHSMIETFGGTRRYMEFRQRVRDYYRFHYHLSARAASNPCFNPGDSGQGVFSYEPKVGEFVLRDMVQLQQEAGRLQIVYRTHAVGVEMDREDSHRIGAVVAQAENGQQTRYRARYVLDATDQGDLLPLCGEKGRDWVAGSQSRSDTGEPDAPPEEKPKWVQPFTFTCAIDWSPETMQTNIIPKPLNYDEVRRQQEYKILYSGISGMFRGPISWWNYRRLLNRANFDDARIVSDVTMVNTPGNDYYGGNLLFATEKEKAQRLERARENALGYIYWLQTECPREDDPTGLRHGYPEIRLRMDAFDTPDGLAPMPYIRESRRIRAVRTVREQDLAIRDKSTGREWQHGARAGLILDSVGIGLYPIDIHRNGQGEDFLGVKTLPFQIPLGALVPKRLDNLLPASKDLGVTHLTNGAFRMHPIEWNVGESAGALAAFCLRTHQTPRQVVADRVAQRKFQAGLLRQGIPLYWCADVPVGHPMFEAVQRLALEGVPVCHEDDIAFHKGDPIAAKEWAAWRGAVSGNTAPAQFHGTRGQAALTLYKRFPALTSATN
ncbi:MAG TPA: FAD-dependent oxidoreductase [Chthonomonadaceae bacterium]|nr:FAD-dependent oxidoreductase [Chthonomonadaceae bacterium]